MSVWNERFATEEYVYGTEPNDFLVEASGRIPGPRVLSLAEGEGRNGAWLAGRGFDVTAVDSSAVGLTKARKLAESRGVSIHTVLADLADFDPGESCWDGIISIFCHLPVALRRQLHQRVDRALAPGGVFILEAYTPEQLAYGTGGPKSAELMMDAASLRAELAGLEIIRLEEVVREIGEGRLHSGAGAVVQLLARRP